MIFDIYLALIVDSFVYSPQSSLVFHNRAPKEKLWENHKILL